MMLAIPSSLSLSCCCPKICNANVRMHLTSIFLILITFLASLRYVTTYPLYSVLVLILFGPVLIITTLIHECAHLCMSRWLLLERTDTQTEIMLWPLGGYHYCDGLSASSVAGERSGSRGTLKADLLIALAGVLSHGPQGLFWFLIYLSINSGQTSDFEFRTYFTIISSGPQGFFSTVCEQSILLNILLMWFNLFLPVYPLDGGRIMTSAMLLMGVALNKAALLTMLITMLVSLVLFVMSIISFIDGIGISGTFGFLLSIFAVVKCYQLYFMITGGRLRDHKLFGRACYINRVSRPGLFQLSNAARMASTAEGEDDQDDQREDETMVPTETEAGQSS